MTDSDRISENAVLKMCVLEKCKTVIWQQLANLFETRGVSPVYGKVSVHSVLHKVCMVQMQALQQTNNEHSDPRYKTMLM